MALPDSATPDIDSDKTGPDKNVAKTILQCYERKIPTAFLKILKRATAAFSKTQEFMNEREFMKHGKAHRSVNLKQNKYIKGHGH